MAFIVTRRSPPNKSTRMLDEVFAGLRAADKKAKPAEPADVHKNPPKATAKAPDVHKKARKGNTPAPAKKAAAKKKGGRK